MFISSQVFANCTGSYPNNIVNISSEPIRYVTNLNSEEIKNQAKRLNVGSSDLFGAFVASEKIQMSSRIKYSGSSYSVCANIVNFNLDITLEPTIYVAKETNLSRCVNARVYEHENEHYKRTMKSIEQTKIYAKELLDKASSIDFSGSSTQEVNSKIKSIETEIQNNIYSFLNKKDREYNDPLDTIENYERESKFCPSSDEMLVMGQIKSINKSF